MTYGFFRVPPSPEEAASLADVPAKVSAAARPMRQRAGHTDG